MTMHRIILDTLWTMASEVLCLPKNAVNLATKTLRSSPALLQFGPGTGEVVAPGRRPPVLVRTVGK